MGRRGDDAMPCGGCHVCGDDELDFSEAGICQTCGSAFCWTRCGSWHNGQHTCNECREAASEEGEDKYEEEG